MFILNLENPTYEESKLNELLDNSKIDKYSYSYIRPNIKSILKDVSDYFKNNIKKYLIMKDLIDGVLGSYININLDKDSYSEIIPDISLRMIDYYCHKYEKEWYRNICLKYRLPYNFMCPLSCFVKDKKIKVILKDHVILLSFTNLIFYKHLFEDKIYEKIQDNKKDLDNQVLNLKKTINLNDNSSDEDSLDEINLNEDYINSQIVGLPINFVLKNKIIIVLFVIFMLFYGLYDEYSNNNLLNNVSKIVDL